MTPRTGTGSRRSEQRERSRRQRSAVLAALPLLSRRSCCNTSLLALPSLSLDVRSTIFRYVFVARPYSLDASARTLPWLAAISRLRLVLMQVSPFFILRTRHLLHGCAGVPRPGT